MRANDELIERLSDADPEVRQGAAAELERRDQSCDDSRVWPRPLDLRALAATEPQAPPMLIDDWLPAGYATLFAGHGGAGKSAIALHLAASIATGRPFFGLEVAERRVLYLSCEDRERVLHWRLARICAYLDLDMGELTGRLDVLDLVGHDAVLYQRDPTTGSDLTAPYGELARTVRETGAEVVVADGTADTFGGSENARAEVKRYVNALVALIPPERGAVVLVAHVNKPTAASGTAAEGYSGSTAWHNAARARWYLRPEVDDGDDGREATGDLLLELQKSNLGNTDQALRFRWDDERRLFVGERELSGSEFDRRARDRQEREAIVACMRAVTESGDYVPAATNASRTAYNVLRHCEHWPVSFNGSGGRRRFWRHIEALRRNGEVRESSVRRANRHYTATLVPTAPAKQGCAAASHNGEPKRRTPDADLPASLRRSDAGGLGDARTHSSSAGWEDTT